MVIARYREKSEGDFEEEPDSYGWPALSRKA
jgi:hypothetical protein